MAPQVKIIRVTHPHLVGVWDRAELDDIFPISCCIKYCRVPVLFQCVIGCIGRT